MSRYSGKCDLYDHFDETDLSNLSNYKIYAYNNIVPLHITSEKDLVPYYPYLVVAAGYNTVDGKRTGTIHLSKESFAVREEREHLTFSLNNVLRYYRRCKRKHIPFTEEEAIDHFSSGLWITATDKDIIKRVAENGEKTTIEGLHTPMGLYYRQELFKEMTRVGYTVTQAASWVYGDDWDLARQVIKENSDEKYSNELS